MQFQLCLKHIYNADTDICIIKVYYYVLASKWPLIFQTSNVYEIFARDLKVIWPMLPVTQDPGYESHQIQKKNQTFFSTFFLF